MIASLYPMEESKTNAEQTRGSITEIIRFEFYDEEGVDDEYSWADLFVHYTSEEGTPCGIEPCEVVKEDV